MYNRVILMGRLTADPELRQTQSGISMCRVSIAVERGYAKQGEEKKTDFFDVTFWRQTADFVCRYFSKGRMIHVEGKLQNDNYTDQNGVKHYRNVIIAESVDFCGDKSNNQQNGYQNQQQGNYQNQYQPNDYQQPQQPQQYQQPQQPMYAAPAPPPAIGDMSDFEEILSDGDTPF